MLTLKQSTDLAQRNAGITSGISGNSFQLSPVLRTSSTRGLTIADILETKKGRTGSASDSTRNPMGPSGIHATLQMLKPSCKQ